MTLAQDLPIALPTSSRKFSPYLASYWKGCGEAGTFAGCWWSCSELYCSGTEILAHMGFFRKFSLSKDSRKMRCWGVLGAEPQPVRPKRVVLLQVRIWALQKHLSVAQLFKNINSSGTSHWNFHNKSKTTDQLRWVTLRGYKLCLDLIQSVAYEETIQLLINLFLGCQIFFKGFWSLEHYFFAFPATLKFFRGVQYSRVMKLFSEGITW